jgi:hypothetical protein
LLVVAVEQVDMDLELHPLVAEEELDLLELTDRLKLQQQELLTQVAVEVVALIDQVDKAEGLE